MESIRLERESLEPIRNMADLVLDSSHLTPYELAEKVDLFCLQPGEKKNRINCTVVSFSYKQGLPANADLVFDMRFLPNPHYQPELAPQTGRDQDVISFLENYEDVKEAEQHIQRWLAFSWPLVRKERKQYLTIALGCSGGRHRSVYMAEQIARWLNHQGWAEPTVQHRELGITHHSAINKTQESKQS